MNITLPFHEYIDDLLGDKCNGVPYVHVSENKAKLIAAIDKNESFVHVSFHDFDGSRFRDPRVYRVTYYKSEYGLYKIRKEQEAANRREWCLLTENSNRLIKSMLAEEHMDYEDARLFAGLARKIAMRKNKTLFDSFNAHLEL